MACSLSPARAGHLFERDKQWAFVMLQTLALNSSAPLQLETIRVNVLGMLNLADICFEKKIHLTTYATGCIFHYDKDFPEGSGKGFKESDKPNFTGSYYSYTKASHMPKLLSTSVLLLFPRRTEAHWS